MTVLTGLLGFMPFESYLCRTYIILIVIIFVSGHKLRILYLGFAQFRLAVLIYAFWGLHYVKLISGVCIF